MEKKDGMPLWVFLALANIRRRHGALWLIASSGLFTLYCLPWSRYFAGTNWVEKIFLIDDWSWFAMMVPITLWYWLSLRWVDSHGEWENAKGSQ